MTTTFKILEMSASTNEYHRAPTWRSHRLVRFWPWISFKVKWEGCWFNLVKTANRFGHEWSWSCSDGCKDMYIQNNYRRLRILILNHIRSIRAASLTWDHMWKIRIEKIMRDVQRNWDVLMIMLLIRIDRTLRTVWLSG